LAFARKQTISPKVLDLNDTVAGMLKMLRRLIGEDIDLGWHPGPSLWKVKIDPSQVDQLLANLTVNARDAVEKAGRIVIETANALLDEAYCADKPECLPGEYVALAVSDNGCGMDKETLAYIFEPFFTTKREGQGTGLGLATVYGIVKQNEGFIMVDSEPGRGTTFRAYLPRYQDASLEDKDKKTEVKIQGGTETVLIVEDEQTVLKLTQTMLETLGYNVLASREVDQALRLVGEYDGSIDLLISDVVMPNMNGKELSERIMAVRPGIKCLFMSGYTADVIARQGVLDEDIQFISKPFTFKQLAAKVREVLG
jgi:CheY-like chemotaxis protein